MADLKVGSYVSFETSSGSERYAQPDVFPQLTHL